MMKREQLFDKRVVDRAIRKRLLTREEYEAYLKNLPDVSNNVVKNETDS